LVAVPGLSEDEVDDVIDDLEDALVLEPRGTDGWRFRHELRRFDPRGRAARAVLADAADHLPTDSALPEMVRARVLLG
jgi:hypothetical protein